MKHKMGALLVLMSATVLLGELKYTPFQSDFRISFGSGIFFFILIWVHRLPIIVSSVLTGTAVVIFRMWLDEVTMADFTWSHSFMTHGPSLVFYVVFGFILRLGSVYKNLKNPIKLGVLGFLGDFLADVTELLTRHDLIYHQLSITPMEMYLLVILAFVRSFFVVGFFNIIQVRHLRAVSREQQLRVDQLLMISSELHMEALYLQKVMGHIEQVTRNSYHLYRDLKNTEQAEGLATFDPPLSLRALRVAEEVHEIKKDSQRIVSGMGKIIDQESVVEQMPVAEIIQLVKKANDKYARMLGKNIAITALNEVDLATNKVYSLLSVLNNLLSNAVEAIEREGAIHLAAYRTDRQVVFQVSDSGVGIPEGDEPFIFRPGYTTKFDKEGNPSTGIGLAHVVDIVSQLHGAVEMNKAERPYVTTFTLTIPTLSLQKGE